MKAIGFEVVWESPIAPNSRDYDDVLVPQGKLTESQIQGLQHTVVSTSWAPVRFVISSILTSNCCSQYYANSSIFRQISFGVKESPSDLLSETGLIPKFLRRSPAN